MRSHPGSRPVAPAQNTQEACEAAGRVWEAGQCRGNAARKRACEAAGGIYYAGPDQCTVEIGAGADPLGAGGTYSGSGASTASIGTLQTESGNGQIILTWPACATSRAPNSGCKYRIREDGGDSWSEWAELTQEVGGRSRLAGLKNCQKYALEVRSNRDGSTTSASAVAGLPGIPDPPSTAAGDGQIALHGQPPEDGSSPLKAIFVRETASNSAQPAQVDRFGWQATATGLANGETYRFRSQSINACGAGGVSLSSLASPSVALPVAPAGLVAEPGYRGTYSLVTLRWDQDLDGTVSISADGTVSFDGGTLPGVTGHEYRFKKYSESRWLPKWTPVPESPSARSLEFLGLIFGDRYVFEVRANGADGPGAVSSTTIVPAIPPTPDERPWGFTADWTHANQAELRWGSRPLALTTFYQYRVSGDSGETWTEWTEPSGHCEGVCGATVPVTVEGADRLQFQLRRRGRQAASDAWTGTHPDAPRAPVLGEPEELETGGLSLAWSAADTGNPATAWEFRSVFLDAPSGSTWTDWTAMQPMANGDSGYEFSPLTLADDAPSGLHAIQVRGTNAHGVGSKSNLVTVSH